MKRNLQDIDDLFRNGLEDYSEPASHAVWNSVSNDLDKKQALLFRQKYFRLRKMALMLLLFIFSGIAFVFYFSRAGIEDIVLAQKQPASTKETGNPTAPPARQHESINDHKSLSKAAEPAADKKEYVKDTVVLKTAAPAQVEVAGSKPVAVRTSLTQIHNSSHQLETPVKGVVNYTLTAVKQHADKQHIPVNRTRVVIAANRPSKAVKGSAVNDYFTFREAAVERDNNRIQHTRQETYDKDKGAFLNETNKKQTAHAAAAYQFQPVLFLSQLVTPAPGPLVAMENAPWFNQFIQNDSLGKVIAAAKKKKASLPTVSIMAFVAPNHSFTRLENDARLAGPGRNKYAAQRDERQGASVSAGMLVNYAISQRFILQSGLVFSSAKTNILPKIIYARPDNSGHARYEFNCASGYSYITPKTGQQPAVGDSLQVMGSSSSITYIGIPLSLNYVWQRGRLLLKPGIGVSVNFLTGGNSATRIGNTPDNRKEIASITGLKKSYADASIGFGTEWMLNRKISIGVRPLLRMALTSINKDTPVKAYQNYLSLETGLKINL